MFGAIGRWFKAVGYLLTGRIDAARRVLDTNPHVMRAQYDEIIKEKTGRIQQYKQAVAGLIAQQEHKLAKMQTLTEEVEKIERLKVGALAKAKQRVTEMGTADKAAIQADGEYQKCLGAYNDFSSTLSEKQERITELEADIQDYGRRVSEHKVQLQHLARDIDKLKSESHDAVADLIGAKQEKEISDALSGIGEDGSDKELQRLRDMRREIKAEAKISKELAGTDARVQEAEFLEYARTSSSNSEFESLVGLAGSVDAKTDEKPVHSNEAKTALPE